MRTLFVFLVFVMVSMTLTAGNAITGKSNTMLGDYRIVPVDENKYQLNYSNGSATFTIEVCHKSDECCYLLRGDAIELMYQCNELGFGMRKMPETYKKLEICNYKQLIDPEAFSQQSLLTGKQKSEHDALALIACFFPLVIKGESLELVFDKNLNVKTEELSVK